MGMKSTYLTWYFRIYYCDHSAFTFIVVTPRYLLVAHLRSRPWILHGTVWCYSTDPVKERKSCRKGERALLQTMP